MLHRIDHAYALLVLWQVPANRLGSQRGGLSAAQLRAIAEAGILSTFLIFSTVVLRQPLLWNHVAGFAIVMGGVVVVLMGPFPGAVIPQSSSTA
eukprot:2903148-Pleurochrysis_carterae.AAC.5